MPGKDFKDLGFQPFDKVRCTASEMPSLYKPGNEFVLNEYCHTYIEGSLLVGTMGDWEIVELGNRPVDQKTATPVPFTDRLDVKAAIELLQSGGYAVISPESWKPVHETKELIPTVSNKNITLEEIQAGFTKDEKIIGRMVYPADGLPETTAKPHNPTFEEIVAECASYFGRYAKLTPDHIMRVRANLIDRQRINHG